MCRFRTPKSLTFKTVRSSAKPFCKKEFYVHENKTHFHIKGFTLNLVLKQRFDATQKWPIRRSGILRN